MARGEFCCSENVVHEGAVAEVRAGMHDAAALDTVAGFFKVLEKSGLSERLAKGLSPAARRLVRSQDRQALALVCQNIAANLLGRRFLGIDQAEEYLDMSRNRKLEIEDTKTFVKYKGKIKDIAFAEQAGVMSACEEILSGYELPF